MLEVSLKFINLKRKLEKTISISNWRSCFSDPAMLPLCQIFCKAGASIEIRSKMSYFPDFLQLQRSASNNWTEKSDCQMPRATMNELIMNYLVTGKAVNFVFFCTAY